MLFLPLRALRHNCISLKDKIIEEKCDCVSLKEKVYHYERRIKGILDRIDKSEICEENKEDLLEFHRNCIIRGLSKGRISKYLDTLQRVSEWLGKSFSKVGKRI